MLSRPAILITTIVLLIGCTASAQNSWLYTPLKDDPDKLRVLQTAIRKQYEKDSAAITGDNKKYLLAIYRERLDVINEMFAGREVIQSQEVSDYLDRLATGIIDKNPVLKSINPRFVFNRAYWPNAASFGEGTIICNIGLFSKLKNEAQVVFALCHELAHLYLNHGNNAINQYINTVYSDEFQAKLKEIKKSEYEKNRQADKLIKGFAFNIRRHGRAHESEADSLALVFMKNTVFDSRESLGCLAVLDSIDADTNDLEKDIQQLFSSSEFGFKEKWIKKEAAFFGVTAETKISDKEADSLKTHPDCKTRIIALTPAVQQLDNSSKLTFNLDKTAFENMQHLFRYEAMQHCYQSGRISRCLYLSINLFQQNPSDPYLAAMIGRCLDTIYYAQKNHTLNRIVDLPSPYTSKNYNNLLEFIQKLSLGDIAAISYYFLKKYETQFIQQEDFVYALVKSKSNFDMPMEKKQWQEYYLKTFSNPKYKF